MAPFVFFWNRQAATQNYIENTAVIEIVSSVAFFVKDFITHTILEGILGDLSLIIWIKSFESFEEESLLGEIDQPDYEHNIEVLLEKSVKFVNSLEAEHFKGRR